MAFPWAQYHDGPDGLPFTVDITIPRLPHTRSKLCSHLTIREDYPCDECGEMYTHIYRLIDIARNPKAHTNYKFLGLAHMQDLVKKHADQVNELKLQACNNSCKYIHALTQLDNYNRLLMAISHNNIPRIHQIVNVAMRNEGVYCPQGYGADDLDIVTLIFRLGGHQLLFALNHKLGLPSLCTLHVKSTFTSLMPTIDPICNDQLNCNIQAIIVDTCAASVPLHGVSFMIDKIALEEMAVHFSKYNKVGGLCWKHSHVVDPVLHTYESAVNIAQKIHKGEVHLGKELTVIGVSCFVQDEIYPVLAAPTCKMEDANDMEVILTQTIDQWNASSAAASVGLAWSFVTDSDATRRAAGHRLFVKTFLPPDSTLYGTLINMPGLNLFTGAGEMTLDFDFKHIFKSVTKLLHLDDPQDVPRVVELMLAVIEFSKTQHTLISDSFSIDVDTRADLTSISLLSALLRSILIPFIDVDLSLSQQFDHLSRYAHLAFAFFHAHRCSFMSYQLYYDTQTMVKNAFFCLAKQQSLDPHAPFFLGDVGDDPLEILFGCMRMIGGHNSACSYAQALDRLGTAKDIDGVFKCHPELDPGHHQLKLTCQEGVDHINWEIWKGNIISGQCDLPLAWHKGHDDALSILITSQLAPAHYSFMELFSTREVDMLRPFSQNKYLGVSTDDKLEDTSHVPEVPLPIPVPPPIQSLETVLSNKEEELPNEQQPLLGELMGSENDEEIMLMFQEALIDECPSDVPSAPSDIHHPLDPSAPPLPAGPGIRPEDYLLYHGHWIHKQTVCRLVANKDFVSKSLNRLEHVRAGYTKVNKHIDMSAGCITDHNLFLVGDIFLTILRSGRTLSISVLRSTTATLNGISHTSINIAVMKASRSTAKITGQLLTVVPTLPAPDVPQSFLWDGGYVTACSIIQGTNESTARIVVVTVPGALVEPVNGGQSTWQISREAMQAACDLLWAKAGKIKVTLKTIAAVTPSDAKSFPYQLSDSTLAILSVEASSQLCVSKGETIVICPLCKTKVTNMHYHMGLHILCTLNNIPEDVNMKQLVSNVYPCGFCGCSGHPDCAITITIKNTATGNAPMQWNTKCIYQHGFRYLFAEQGSKNKPVRNVPLKCELCHPILPPEPGKSSRRVPAVAIDAIWCYNMVEHVLNEHEEYSVPGCRAGGMPVLPGVLKAMQLTELEQASANIPKEKWQPFSIPGDGHDKENVVPSTSCTSKRSAPSTTAPQASKKARTNLTNAHSAVSLRT
ncbi:hypothetical protein EDB19DRAFT_1824124 [Suillus lakei]|nr:hypothetical protein EDB19DRAFT_1824124 [Suillus lakei]